MSMSHLVAEPVNEPAGQRRTTAAAIAVVALIIVAVIVIGGPSFGPPGGAFTAWVNEVQDDDGDRGWNRLEASIQDAYGGDRDAYLADVERVDWDQFRVDYPAERWSDDGFARVEAALVSAPSSVPAFLFDRRIIHGICDENGQPTVIGAYEDRRPFIGGRFSGGGVTGSQARCNAAFGVFGER